MFQNKQMSIGDWFIFLILMAIPILNIILFIMLVTNPKTNPSLKNLMLMQLIMFAVLAVLVVIAVLLMGSFM